MICSGLSFETGRGFKASLFSGKAGVVHTRSLFIPRQLPRLTAHSLCLSHSRLDSFSVKWLYPWLSGFSAVVPSLGGKSLLHST